MLSDISEQVQHLQDPCTFSCSNWFWKPASYWRRLRLHTSTARHVLCTHQPKQVDIQYSIMKVVDHDDDDGDDDYEYESEN